MLLLRKVLHTYQISAGICLLKVSNRNTRTRSKICSKLTPERRQTPITPCSSVSSVIFEHVNPGWDG